MLALTIRLLDVVTRFAAFAVSFRASQIFDVEHKHQFVQQPVDDFETCFSTAVQSCAFPDITSSSLLRIIFHYNIVDFEDLHR